jgi:hypothetical protein
LQQFKIDALAKVGYKKLTLKDRTRVCLMDLQAASNQNSTMDRLTRLGMVICFLATGTLLIGALTIDAHGGGGSNSNFAFNPQSSPR